MLRKLSPPLLAAAFALATAAQAQGAPKVSFSPAVHVTIQMDSANTTRFDARGFDLNVRQESAGGSNAQLVKQAGPLTNDLVRMSASGAHLLSVTVEVLDSLGVPAATIRLSNVTIDSDHLSLSVTRANLEQQRISQAEALSALTADYQDAQRQLATLEQLGKTRIATPQDLARARDRASDLQHRIDLLKERQALLATQLAGQGPLEETLVLRFASLDIVTKS